MPDIGRFCRIPNLADSRYWGIPEFCKVFNDFRGIPVKIHKILGEIHGFPVKLTKHFLQNFQCRPWGWILSGIAHLLARTSTKERMIQKSPK